MHFYIDKTTRIRIFNIYLVDDKYKLKHKVKYRLDTTVEELQKFIDSYYIKYGRINETTKKNEKNIYFRYRILDK